jgi:type IV pilus assembly protein PilM
MFGFLPGKRVLGIDLGTKNIKIVEVEKFKDSIMLLNYIIIEFKAETQISSILQTSQIFEENLGKILEEVHKEFKTKNVVFSIPTSYVFSSYFSLPHMPLSTLKQAVFYEYKKYLPTSEKDYYIDWRNLLLQPVGIETTPKWFVFFSATPVNFIEKLKNVSKIARLNFKAAEVEFYGLENLFKNVNDNIIVVDIGYGYSYSILITENKVMFIQKIKISVKTLIDTIKSLLEINDEEAENFLTKRGFRLMPEEIELKNNLEEIINNLALEINKIKDNLEERFNIKIKGIYFIGGASLVPGFLEKISEKIPTVPVNVFNPLDSINVDKSLKNLQIGPLLTNALGVCLKYFYS